MIRGTRCTQTLDVDTAAAVASGVFLRLGIEQAARASGGSLSHAGVLAALRAVDNETFFGRITIDNAQRNTASSDEIVQWDCAGGSSCIQRTIEASGGETLRAFDAACSIGSFRHYNNVTGKERSCVKCAEVDPYFIEEHVLGPTRSSVAVSILAACPVFGSPVVVSFRILGPLQANMTRGMQYGVQHVKARNQELLGNVPLLVEEVPSGPFGTTIFSSGGGFQATLNVSGVLVDLSPPAHLQGRAAANLALVAGLMKVQVLRCGSAVCGRMSEEFALEANRLEIEIGSTVLVRKPSLRLELFPRQIG